MIILQRVTCPLPPPVSMTRRCIMVRAASILELGISLVYSSAMKMEEKCSSETSVDFKRTTRCYISEDFNTGYKCFEEMPRIRTYVT
jgi:hypothetical protein